MGDHQADCLCKAKDGRSIPNGTFVFTQEDCYRERWFFDWPGVVIRKRGRRAVVEFLGWGRAKRRRKKLPGKFLQLIDNIDLLTRLHRVGTRLRTEAPQRKRRKAP